MISVISSCILQMEQHILTDLLPSNPLPHPIIICNKQQQYLFWAMMLMTSGVARTQPMPGHSVGTPCLLVASYPSPAQLLSRLRYGMRKQLGGSGDAPTENFGLHSSILRLRKAIPSHELEHFDYAFATNLYVRSQRKVTVVEQTGIHWD